MGRRIVSDGHEDSTSTGIAWPRSLQSAARPTCQASALHISTRMEEPQCECRLTGLHACRRGLPGLGW